jgi:hypothetical protein
MLQDKIIILENTRYLFTKSKKISLSQSIVRSVSPKKDKKINK